MPVPVLAPNLAHEVQDGENPLSFGPQQPSSQLLEKHRGALGWTKHEHGVDLRQVDTLVEEIDGEDGAKLSPRHCQGKLEYLPGAPTSAESSSDFVQFLHRENARKGRKNELYLVALTVPPRMLRHGC